MTQVAEKLQPWLAALERTAAGGPRWLQDLRDRGAVAIREPRIPDDPRRGVAVHERRADRRRRVRAGAADAAPLTERDSTRFRLRRAAHRLVFVNGRFAPELSRDSGLPAGVRVGSLAGAIERQSDAVAAAISGSSRNRTAARSRRSTPPSSQDGAYVLVPDGVVLEEPLQILFVSCRLAAAPVDVHPRTLIVARRTQPGADRRNLRRAPGDGVLHQRGDRGRCVGENAVARSLQGAAGERRRVPHRQHARRTRRAAPRSRRTRSRSAAGWSATTSSPSSTARAPSARSTASISPTASGWSTTTRRSITRSRTARATRSTRASSAARRARCSTARSSSVQDAQKTDAKQTNRALLLSDDAPINTKPQLEIFADDVKCTHGAAIGQLDEDAMFYLRARGLTFAEARDMLIHAFAGEILDRVKIEPLRTRARGRALRAAGQGSRRGRRAA